MAGEGCHSRRGCACCSLLAALGQQLNDVTFMPAPYISVSESTKSGCGVFIYEGRSSWLKRLLAGSRGHILEAD